MIVKDAADIEAARHSRFRVLRHQPGQSADQSAGRGLRQAEIPVVSNNSARTAPRRMPMLIPEVNADHVDIIASQRKRLGTKRGFIAVKPNCSIQSYVPALTPLLDFGVEQVVACTYQAISGAGKTFDTWPEMIDNVIPFISGEDKKRA